LSVIAWWRLKNSFQDVSTAEIRLQVIDYSLAAGGEIRVKLLLGFLFQQSRLITATIRIQPVIDPSFVRSDYYRLARHSRVIAVTAMATLC
jgi:hypothetical protein